MDETKTKESVYSGERTTIAGPDSLRGTRATEAATTVERTAPPANPQQEMDTAGLAEMPRTGEYSWLADLGEFLKRTKRGWLIAAGATVGLMAVMALTERMTEWARNAREKRHEQAAATVTPESLIARCGPPAGDVTKEVFPVVMRTMRYEAGEKAKIVFEFSRTAEEKSDWVFLSMKDESGAQSYDTPEAKIAAMTCLDSKK